MGQDNTYSSLLPDVWSNGYAGVWLMNEGEGTTVHDYSGNGNHGMINMDPATDWVELTMAMLILMGSGYVDFPTSTNFLNHLKRELQQLRYLTKVEHHLLLSHFSFWE